MTIRFLRLISRVLRLIRKLFTTSSCRDYSVSLREPFITSLEAGGIEWVQLLELPSFSPAEIVSLANRHYVLATKGAPILYGRDGSEDDLPGRRAGIVRQVVAITRNDQLTPSIMGAIALRAGLATRPQLEDIEPVTEKQLTRAARVIGDRKRLGIWAEIQFTRPAVVEILERKRSRIITRLKIDGPATITGVYLA